MNAENMVVMTGAGGRRPTLMKRLRRLISGRRSKGAKAEPAVADDDEHDEPVYAQTRRASMAPRSSSDSGTDIEFNPSSAHTNADDNEDDGGHYARADHVVPPRDAQQTQHDGVLLRNKGPDAPATLSPAARRAALLRRRSCASEPGDGDGPELPPRRYSAVIKPDGSLTLLPPLPAPPGQGSTAGGGGPRSSLSAGVSAASPSPSLAHDAPDSPPLVMHSRLAQLRGFKPLSKEGERCDSGLASNASDDHGSICSLPRALADAVSSSGSREALAAEVRRHSISSGQGSHRSLLNSKGQAPAESRGVVSAPPPPQCDHHYESLEGADGSDSEDEEVQIYGQEVKLPQSNQGKKQAPTAQPVKGPVVRDTARGQAYEAWDHCSRAEPESKITDRTEAFFAQRASGGSGHLRQLASTAALSGGTTPEDGDDDVDDRGMTRLVGRPEDDDL